MIRFFKCFFVGMLILTAGCLEKGTPFVEISSLSIPGVPMPVISVKVNAKGEISFETKVECPTFLGSVAVGVEFDPREQFKDKEPSNTLTIIVNENQCVFDLHGQHVDIHFGEGYYQEVNLKSNPLTNDWVLEIQRVEESSLDQLHRGEDILPLSSGVENEAVYNECAISQNSEPLSISYTPFQGLANNSFLDFTKHITERYPTVLLNQTIGFKDAYNYVENTPYPSIILFLDDATAQSFEASTDPDRMLQLGVMLLRDTCTYFANPKDCVVSLNYRFRTTTLENYYFENEACFKVENNSLDNGYTIRRTYLQAYYHDGDESVFNCITQTWANTTK